MKKILILLVGLYLSLVWSGCAGASSDDPSGDPLVSKITINHTLDPDTAIPLDFDISLKVDIVNSDLKSSNTYRVKACFRGGGGSLVEMGDFPVTATASSQIQATFSIPSIGLPSDVLTPYRLFFQLQDVTSGSPVILAESAELSYQPGPFTGDYKGHLQYYGSDGIKGNVDDSYAKLTMKLYQFGSRVVGQMTEVVSNPLDTPEVVNVAANVNGTSGNLDNMSLDGMGKIEGDLSLLSYSGSLSVEGAGLKLLCDGYTRSDGPSTRGDFNFVRVGSSEIGGSITIPNSAFVGVNGVDWQVVLMFSLLENPGEKGVWWSQDGTITSPTIDYTFTDVPDGDFFVVFMTDIAGNHQYSATGDCFAMGGVSAAEAGTLFSKYKLGTLVDSDLVGVPQYNPSSSSPIAVDFPAANIFVLTP